MRAQFFFLAVFVTTMLRVSHCIGQSNVVFYGVNTNAIAVTFVDTNLSVSARASIVGDLQLCLQEWGKGTQFRLGADDPAFVAHLYNPDITPHYPETIDYPANVVSNGTAGFALQIPKKLSDVYTNAFAFASANSNIVAAAYDFVAFVASTNFAHIPSNSLPDYIIFKNVQSNIVVCGAQTILSKVSQKVYPPSILGFYYSTEGPSATNLWVRIPQSVSSYGGTVAGGVFPSAIWHENKWKFCIWDRIPGVP